MTDYEAREFERVRLLMEDPDMIFVFGSNEGGRHGSGAAADAHRLYGAIMGAGVGLQGRSWAIPTKSLWLDTLPLFVIEGYAQQFIVFARRFPMLKFAVTRIGCGLAGYTDADIAPMFKGAPSNTFLPEGW